MPGRTDDEIIAELTGPGAAFELVDVQVRGESMRGFKRAEAALSSLFAAFEIHGSRPFIADGEQRLSYAETGAAAARLAAVLAERGIAPGDRVAIAMRNSAEWMVGFIACVAHGAIPALVNSRGAAAEMAGCIDRVGARLVLADHSRAAALAGCGVPVVVPALDASPSGPKLVYHTAAPEDPAMILFTSGTTGAAKGATLSHRAALTGLLLPQMAGATIATGMAAALGMDLPTLAASRPPATALLAVPLFHVSGCQAVFLSSLAGGGRIVVAPRWEPAAILRLMEAERVTSFGGTPTMVWDLLDAPERADTDLSALGSLAAGGQATPPNMLRAIGDAFPGVTVGTGFGMTETSGGVVMATGDAYLSNPRAAGRILPLARIRIMGADGREAEIGAAGAIEVKGPMVMDGYWNDPAGTAAAFRDGWYRTGDIGMLDERGYLTIVDRLTDMVITGGENIYCAEVEAALQEHPQIVEAATYGVPDARLGERLVAVVRLASGVTLGEPAVLDHLEGRIARYKRPTQIRIADTPLPRGTTGKIDKRALRADHAG